MPDNLINFPPEFIAHRLRLNPSTSRQIEEHVKESSLKEFYQIISELADPNISADDELFYLMVKAAVFRGDYKRCFKAAGSKQHPGILSWKAVALARTGQVENAVINPANRNITFRFPGFVSLPVFCSMPGY